MYLWPVAVTTFVSKSISLFQRWSIRSYYGLSITLFLRFLCTSPLFDSRSVAVLVGFLIWTVSQFEYAVLRNPHCFFFLAFWQLCNRLKDLHTYVHCILPPGLQEQSASSITNQRKRRSCSFRIGGIIVTRYFSPLSHLVMSLPIPCGHATFVLDCSSVWKHANTNAVLGRKY